jgi:formate dehydrogenase major subunit
MEILPERGEDPLRRLNFRFSGKPTPQMGVEVNRKWKRADYYFPGEPALIQIHLAAPEGSK